MVHNLTKQLANCKDLHEWADSGDFHGTPHWCVLKSASSWGQMLPNIAAVRSLLGQRFNWRDVSSHNDYMRHCLDTHDICYQKTPWLYEVTSGKSSFLVREFRREDDPNQKCYIQEIYVKGFLLDAVYRGDGESACVDLSRTLVVMPMSAEASFPYQPEQE